MQGGDRVIATFAVPRASLADSAVDVFVTRPSDTSLLPRVGFFVNNTRALRPLLATPPLPASLLSLVTVWLSVQWRSRQVKLGLCVGVRLLPAHFRVPCGF